MHQSPGRLASTGLGLRLDSVAHDIVCSIWLPTLVVDYDQLRKEAGEMSKAKAEQVQGLVAKLQKTQRAAEDALDKCNAAFCPLSNILNRIVVPTA